MVYFRRIFVYSLISKGSSTHRKEQTMKLMTYSLPEAPKDMQIGLYIDRFQSILPLSETGLAFSSMNELIEKITPAQSEQLKEEVQDLEQMSSRNAPASLIPMSGIIRRSPIPFPAQDIICLGINYAAHAEESARYKKEEFVRNREYPVYFAKRVNEAVPDGGAIPAHSDYTQRLDYEAELAVVIGKDAYRVKAEDAFDYVFGYTILNDVSAREVQANYKQWYFGKSLEGFCPIGPWIVTADEIPAPPELAIRSYVNGELRQDSNTNLLIFTIPYIIEELSHGVKLKAGTIISTGTPAGVGMGFVPPKFLKAGDTVVCEIEKIGTLTNRVVEDEA